MTCIVKQAALAAIALLMGSQPGVPVARSEDWQPVAASPVSTGRPPALLRAIADTGWRIGAARRALPPVQLVHDEALEIRDFIQRDYDGGALRLMVSPGPHGGEIIALLAETSAPPYRDFARVGSTRNYVAYHHDHYVVVVPVRPVSQTLFDKLKTQQWAKDALDQRLGAPSFNWHVHGVGYFGFTYVPQGLSFIGEMPDGTYQLFGPDFEMGNGELPPIESFANARYAALQRSIRDAFANDLLYEREGIDQALANGKRSPDGRFVVGHVNIDGLWNSEEIVFGEQGKPERRYLAPHFIGDNDYIWLDSRTIIFMIGVPFEQFYSMDAVSGAMELVAKGEEDFHYDRRTTDIGVSDPHAFWYKTADGVVHDVAVQGAAAPAP